MEDGEREPVFQLTCFDRIATGFAELTVAVCIHTADDNSTNVFADLPLIGGRNGNLAVQVGKGLSPRVTLISNAGRSPTVCFCLMFRLLSVMRLMERVMLVPFACTFFSPSTFSSSLIDVPLARTIFRRLVLLVGSFTAFAICFTTLEVSFTVSTFFSTEKSMVITPVF